MGDKIYLRMLILSRGTLPYFLRAMFASLQLVNNAPRTTAV